MGTVLPLCAQVPHPRMLIPVSSPGKQGCSSSCTGVELVPPSAAKHRPVGKCQRGSPERHFCLGNDGETPFAAERFRPARQGLVSHAHPCAGTCSSPKFAWAWWREPRWHSHLYFRTLRFMNCCSSWRWHEQAGKSLGTMLHGDL